MRTVFSILFLAMVLWAESQESVYFRGLDAEASGDITLAMSLFEQAATLDGPYSEEIKEILDDYRDALDDAENPWSFRVQGEVGGVGLRYESSYTGGDQFGGYLLASIEPTIEYAYGNQIHSLGLVFLGNQYGNNDNVAVLDSNNWDGSVGLEYAFIGENLFFDVEADANFYDKQNMSPSVFAWLEYSYLKWNGNRLGSALSVFYDGTGPLSATLYEKWRSPAGDGWGASVLVGARFDADSTQNDAESLDGALYWLKWIGPTLRLHSQYKMNNGFSVELGLSLVYAFVMDGPDSDYEKIGRFSGALSESLKFDMGLIVIYLGFEETYKSYFLPKACEGLYPKNSFLVKSKAGIQFEL